METKQSHFFRFQEPPDFSLVLGGPLYQLLVRSHLEDSALGHLQKRIVVITLLAWLPLMLLSLIYGKAWGGCWTSISV